jgi:hypothetical protein
MAIGTFTCRILRWLLSGLNANKRCNTGKNMILTYLCFGFMTQSVYRISSSTSPHTRWSLNFKSNHLPHVKPWYLPQRLFWSLRALRPTCEGVFPRSYNVWRVYITLGRSGAHMWEPGQNEICNSLYHSLWLWHKLHCWNRQTSSCAVLWA